MKAALLIGFVLLFSCTDTQNKNDSNGDIPDTLQDEYSYEEIISERGYRDVGLVDQVYNKVAARDARLKNFETALKRLNKSKKDSLQSFDSYNEKSESFYVSAKSYIAQIQDSIIKQRMTSIIASSIAQYKASIALHDNLRQVASAKEVMLNDLHTVIKITRTLPVIEKFQKQNLPSAGPIDGYSKLLNEILLQADTLSKQ